MKRHLIMLRHGETNFNAAQRMQGQLDTELSPVGIRQAQAAAQGLKDLGISKIISSDLTRARQTAEIVAAEIGLDVTDDARLRETHLGAWQGLTHDEVDSSRNGIRAHWRSNADWAPPQGESRLDVAKRARPVVDELMDSYAGWDDSIVLLVAHGGTIAALSASLLGLDEKQHTLLRGLENTHTAWLTAQPAFRTDGTQPEQFPSSPNEVEWYLEAWNRGCND